MYFSKFFGSRILGLCFLFLFLFALKFSIQKILALREISFLFIFFLQEKLITDRVLLKIIKLMKMDVRKLKK